MKFVVALLSVILGFSAYAEEKVCGKLSAIWLQTDIYSVTKLDLYNKDQKPEYVTIKDETAIELAIQVVSENPNYEHNSDMDDFYWNWKDDQNRYFMCATGSDLRIHNDRFYMDEVFKLEIWKNGERVD
jgi:hypothetical protein